MVDLAYSTMASFVITIQLLWRSRAPVVTSPSTQIQNPKRLCCCRDPTQLRNVIWGKQMTQLATRDGQHVYIISTTVHLKPTMRKENWGLKWQRFLKCFQIIPWYIFYLELHCNTLSDDGLEHCIYWHVWYIFKYKFGWVTQSNVKRSLGNIASVPESGIIAYWIVYNCHQRNVPKAHPRKLHPTVITTSWNGDCNFTMECIAKNLATLIWT